MNGRSKAGQNVQKNVEEDCKNWLSDALTRKQDRKLGDLFVVQKEIDPEVRNGAVTVSIVRHTGLLLTGNIAQLLVANWVQNTGQSNRNMNEFQTEVFVQVNINIV